MPYKYLSKSGALNDDIQLQEHQQRIQDRATDDSPRMLVYHGLGSGKSLSAIAAAEAAKKLHGGNYGIAVPASLRGNFEKEIQKFTQGSNPEILSYTGLALGKDFQDQPQTLIMDEAHRLRNPGSASARAAAQAAAKAQRLLLLTGSPITNSPTDMANLLALLHNKKITPEEFEKRYIGYKTVRPGILNWLRGIKPGEKPVIKNEKELRQLLSGKIDYQPSKTPEGVNVNEEIVRVPLSPAQDKIQKAIRTKIPPGFLWKLDQEFPLSRDELAKLNSFMTGLRQVSLSTQPFRADKDPVKAFEQSAKLQEAFKRLQKELDSDPRKKAIIYSNFVDSGLGPYAAGLEKAKIPHAFFHGGVSAKARQAAVDAYNQGKLRALLIGPAGAEGLSTKGTSLIQLMDPHWHESRSQQAKGRGLRFDSHRDLPDELKNVAVQRYLSASKDPSFLGKLLGYKRERTGDEVLERLTADKEKLNEEFRRLLKEEGDKYRQQQEEEKQGVARWRTPAALLAFAKKQLPPLMFPARDGSKNLTRGEALQNAKRLLGITHADPAIAAHSDLPDNLPGLAKKLLAETKVETAAPLAADTPPATLFRAIRSANPHPAGNQSFVHGTPALHNARMTGPYGERPYAQQWTRPDGEKIYTGEKLIASYLPTKNQMYGPDWHLDYGVSGLPWEKINPAARTNNELMYETPITAANQFLGYKIPTGAGNDVRTIPNTVAWQNVFGGKHGLMTEIMPRQRTNVPPPISRGKDDFNWRILQKNLAEMQKASAELPDFNPDYTPGQLHRMGVYKSLYEKDGPRLASLGEWKPEWVTEHDPKGWLEWYQNYNAGRRIPDEDMRQIKRWANFKSRHGGPFITNPTARRGWALRNWAINPEKLVPERAEEVRTMLEDYQAQELKKYLKRRFGHAEKQADGALTLAKLLKPALRTYVDKGLPKDLAFIHVTKALKYQHDQQRKKKKTPSPSILD